MRERDERSATMWGAFLGVVSGAVLQAFVGWWAVLLMAVVTFLWSLYDLVVDADERDGF